MVKKNHIFYNILFLGMSGFLGFLRYLPFADRLYGTDVIYLYLALLIVIFIVFVNNKMTIKSRVKWPLIFLFSAISIELIYSFISYPEQSVFSTFKESLYYYILILGFLAYSSLKHNNDAVYLEKTIIIYSVICSTIALFAFVLYTYFGINILKLNTVFSYDGNNFRNGTIRFGVGINIVVFAILFSVNRIIENKNGIIDIANVCLGFLQIVIVQKTRMLIFCLLGTIIITVLLLHTKNKLIKGIGWIISLILILFGILYSDLIVSYANNYFQSDYGILIRFDAIEYYLEQFIHSPIFGMGFISESESMPYYSLLHGSNLRFYRVDVGIVGFINAMGCIAIATIVAYVKIFKNKWKKSDSYSYSLLSYFIFSISTMFTLCIFDYDRAWNVLLFYILLDNLNNRSTSSKHS